MPDKRKAIRQPDGSYLVELKPRGAKVRTVAEPDDFDAHQFEVMAAAAHQLPRTARGGARDLAPDDAQPADHSTRRAAIDSAEVDPSYQPPMPTLAESIERRRYIEGAAPAIDTVYRDPVEEERRRRIEAAALRGARVRHAEDVKFYDPEKPVSL